MQSTAGPQAWARAWAPLAAGVGGMILAAVFFPLLVARACRQEQVKFELNTDFLYDPGSVVRECDHVWCAASSSRAAKRVVVKGVSSVFAGGVWEATAGFIMVPRTRIAIAGTN